MEVKEKIWNLSEIIKDRVSLKEEESILNLAISERLCYLAYTYDFENKKLRICHKKDIKILKEFNFIHSVNHLLFWHSNLMVAHNKEIDIISMKHLKIIKRISSDK